MAFDKIVIDWDALKMYYIDVLKTLRISFKKVKGFLEMQIEGLWEKEKLTKDYFL